MRDGLGVSSKAARSLWTEMIERPQEASSFFQNAFLIRPALGAKRFFGTARGRRRDWVGASAKVLRLLVTRIPIMGKMRIPVAKAFFRFSRNSASKALLRTARGRHRPRSLRDWFAGDGIAGEVDADHVRGAHPSLPKRFSDLHAARNARWLGTADRA